jgi:hypothetical protein
MDDDEEEDDSDVDVEDEEDREFINDAGEDDDDEETDDSDPMEGVKKHGRIGKDGLPDLNMESPLEQKFAQVAAQRKFARQQLAALKRQV